MAILSESTFYSLDELSQLGIKTEGHDVSVHRTVQLFNPSRIRIGSHVRIDCFAVLSGSEEGMAIGSHVHLATGVAIFGSSGAVVLEDFVGLSARVTVYTSNDDYRNGFLTGPTVPEKYRRITTGAVTFRRHAIIGAGTIVLPGTEIGVGAAVGALSLIRGPVPDFAIVAGVPARQIGERNRRLVDLERELLEEELSESSRRSS